MTKKEQSFIFNTLICARGELKIEIKHVKIVEFAFTNGVTNPYRCVLDDDTRAVVKVFNNQQGNLSLVNEYICYILASKIGLPIPDAGICVCDNKTIYNNCNITQDNYGLAFYSTYIEKNTLLKAGIMKYVENINMFYPLVIFDHLVYNKDRNPANLLVEYSNKKIYVSVIDHSHVFKNGTIWDENCFGYGIEENDYLDNEIMERNIVLYQMFYQTINISYGELINTAIYIQNEISDDVLDNALNTVPEDWAVSKNNLDALKLYLQYRREHLVDICKVIYDYIHA